VATVADLAEADPMAEVSEVGSTVGASAVGVITEDMADITVMAASAARQEVSAAVLSAALADIPAWGAGLPLAGRGWAIERQLTPASLTDVGMVLEAD
jgi:hypothetical protein